jgi:hypothetical protein
MNDLFKHPLRDAGFSPKMIPHKILFPLLEAVSLEDNEELHTMFAALLANAASPEHSDKVRPGFIAVLKQMSPEEARILKLIAEQSHPASGVTIPVDEIADPGVSLDGLEAAQLIRRADSTSIGEASDPFDSGPKRALPFANRRNKAYVLTDRGRVFVEACRPPEKATS